MLDILVENLGLAPWFASCVLLPVLFFVNINERLPIKFEGIKTFNPSAFYTVDSVKSSTENLVDVSKW